MNYPPTPEGKDPHLWQLAHKRASFKRHLATFVIINLFFWILWFLTRHKEEYRQHGYFPWPVWPMLGWGIGLLFHYISAYVSTGPDSVEKEYEKLKNQNK